MRLGMILVLGGLVLAAGACLVAFALALADLYEEVGHATEQHNMGTTDPVERPR